MYTLTATNITLQSWGRISLGFFSTKIYKVDQSIHKNIPNLIARQEQGEYYGEKKLYICIWDTIMYEFTDGYKPFTIICNTLRLWNTNMLQKIFNSSVHLLFFWLSMFSHNGFFKKVHYMIMTLKEKKT